MRSLGAGGQLFSYGNFGIGQFVVSVRRPPPRPESCVETFTNMIISREAKVEMARLEVCQNLMIVDGTTSQHNYARVLLASHSLGCIHSMQDGSNNIRVGSGIAS